MVSVAVQWVDKWEGDTGEEGCSQRRKTSHREKWETLKGRERERDGETEEKEGIGECEAGNETVLGQSWREEILTTQHFLPLSLQLLTHTHTRTERTVAVLSRTLTGKRWGLRSILNSCYISSLLSFTRALPCCRGPKKTCDDKLNGGVT